MHAKADLTFLAGGGEMGKRMREMDWAATPLGPVDTWSPTLRMTVSLILANGQPMLLWWGPDYLCLYNDAYIPVLGAKHPWALGQPVREAWSEIFDILKPLIDAPFSGGPPTLVDDIRLDIKRHGFLEETHFTVVYSPVPDPTAAGGIGGVLAGVHEITGKVVGERRVMALRDLGARLAEGRTAEAACAIAAESLAAYGDDVPFALLYLIDDTSEQARLAAATGLAEDQGLCPSIIDLKRGGPSAWPLAEVMRTQATVVPDRLPAGPSAILPIRSTKADELAGFLVAGVSPLIRFDDLYRSFLDLVAGQIATAIANARAYEEERRKTEALAEIDRAKTAFFSNVSHEFRTPLTLMLGPLENTLANESVPATDREQIELAHRSAQRLLKLVNSLLDFSRIEAGRVQATYAPVDLAASTADLASVFRSTVERAGLRLTVDCPPLGEPVYVDGEMWEKIVLNLLSNAFKFTFDGEIGVTLRKTGAEAHLTVCDTGTGIPASEMSRLFERFHRISGAEGRSYEGSGIGLALVQELVRQHGGRVEVESEVGRGSRFHVFVPLGLAHLPADRITETAKVDSGSLRAAPYLEEIKRWLPGEPVADPAVPPESDPLIPSVFPDMRRILLADDNADMRDYLKRLLEQVGYVVETATDGEAALRVARAWKPDLVLTDVMMPRLDGFDLLRALRDEPQLSGMPIILLSARAGEEARIEGMQAGADDYLVKPFGARELLARIQGSLGLARVRREADTAVRKSEERLRALVNASTYVVYRMNADWTEMLELEGQGFIADTDAPSMSWLENYIHPDDRATVTAAVRQAIESKSLFELEHRVLRVDGTLGWTQSRAVPLFDAAGEIVEWFGAASDITHRMQAEETRKLLLRELDHRVKNTLATVQAIAHQTLRYARTPADFAPQFSNRIEAVARVHSLLTEESWRGTSLRHLLREQLHQGPVDESRLEMSGPEIHLDPQVTLHLGLMMHELGTNSVKYGAFSAPSGTVRIDWRLEGETLRLRWVERGGPAAVAPKSRGFGTTLIEQSSKGLGGSARATFEAEGVTWDINFPLPSTTAASPDKADGERSAPPARTEPEAARPLEGQHILVLEDEPLVAMMVEQVLGDAGATIVAVSTEEEALAAIKAGRFDRAALDVNLHGRQVRDVPAALTRIGVPFLFVTGYGRAALPSGFEQAPTLNKPFNNQKLVDSLGALGRNASPTARAV